MVGNSEGRIRVCLCHKSRLMLDFMASGLGRMRSILITGRVTMISEAASALRSPRPVVLLADEALWSGLRPFVERRRGDKRGYVRTILLLDERRGQKAQRGASADIALSPDSDVRTLVRAIRSLWGRGCPDPSDAACEREAPAHPDLTCRQREVLTLIAAGHTNKQVSRILRISVKTVESHRACIMQRFELHNTADLTRFAAQQGLLTPPSAQWRAGRRV